MNTDGLKAALDRAGVDESRYSISGQEYRTGSPPRRSEDHVRLYEYGGMWEITGAEDVVPGWEETLRRFASESEACEVLYRELTRTDRPVFAEERARWAVEAERQRKEGEEELALEEPELAADRAWWAREWRRREATGEPAMTCAELDRALRKAGPGRRARYRIAGMDTPSRGLRTVIDCDSRGRWYAGFWRPEVSDAFIKEVRFTTEAELCMYVYEQATGPVMVPPPLTLQQWRQQRELRTEQREEQDREREELYRLPEGDPKNTHELVRLLWHAGIDQSRYWLAGQRQKETTEDSLSLVRDSATDRWSVEGGQELIPDGSARLREFESEAEACAVFYRELTRTDLPPFAEEKAARVAEAQGGRQEPL